jgi:hypothetical protein
VVKRRDNEADCLADDSRKKFQRYVAVTEFT